MHAWILLHPFSSVTEMRFGEMISFFLIFNFQYAANSFRKNVKDEEEQDNIKAEDDEEGSDTVKEEEDKEENQGEEDMLPDFQHKFEQQLRQPARNLKVKDLVLAFDGESVYGRRSAFLKGVLATVSWQCKLVLEHKPRFPW